MGALLPTARDPESMRRTRAEYDAAAQEVVTLTKRWEELESRSSG